MPNINQEGPIPSLLIVEDEFMIANDLRLMLQKAGYKVVGIAESVPEAKDLVEQGAPDIVLLDIFLDGEQTGIDLAYWLNERNTPFVYLSANLTDTVLKEARQTQPFGFLTKPFREKDVLTTLEIARYRHAHGEETRLRKQHALQIAVNNAIVTIQERDLLGRAIADQVNSLVPFSFFSLQSIGSEDVSGYWLMLQRTSPFTFERINLTSLLQRELQQNENEWLAQESVNLLTELPGIFTERDLDRLSDRYQTVRACRDHLNVQSLALFPIHVNRKLFTLLILGNTHVDSFTTQDYALVNLITPQISLALNNLLAYEELDTHRLIKATELAIVTAFQNGKELPAIMPVVAQALNRLLPFDLLVVHSLENRVLGMGTALLRENKDFQLITDPTRLKWIVEETTILEKESSYKAFRQSTLERTMLDMKSAIGVPVHIQGNPTFSLMLFRQVAYAYTSKDQETLLAISHQFGLSLENLLAYIQIKNLSERLEQEKSYLVEEIKTNLNFDEILGSSPVMEQVFNNIGRVAETDTTVLITGETGTGKELIARAIHKLSSRGNRPMIKVNCAALPTHLIESELFGHERGSFTGANERRIGKFELAHESTIFLDEIGELPLELQAKLLRVLQEKEIERVGGKAPIGINVRIIAATNRNVKQEVAAGRFRSDLYFRLNVFPIWVPPLRDRKEDLLPLALYFLQKLTKKLGKRLTSLSPTALEQMRRYSWPGNIRELEHVLERAAILAQSSTLDLTEPLQSVFPPSDANAEPIRDVEPLQDTMRAAILTALARSGNRIRGKGGAAELLNIKPTTLESRMKKLHINPRAE
ncbi:sigma 54-interacting transcriptional regulator [Spirosoma sp. KNUC1025]|uniref:sigma 54-interacting transcriptional regulator n=1 Tax=Spirosoma sp. KNUC1025 TaxID=2894082 RepID=UPI0038638984|nr:sigma 54-interacting transcriptional regulator [Spirosoma sp. KNUC1025]